MIHRHSRNPDSLDVLQDCQMDVAPVYQTVSYATQDEWDMSDNDSLTEADDSDDPNMDDFYQRVVSSDDEDLFGSDDGSATDLDSDMSEGDYCIDADDGSVAGLSGACRMMRIVVIRMIGTCWRILVIRMFGPLRILTVAGRMLMKRTIVIRI